MSDAPQVVSVEFNFSLYASVVFGNGGVQQKVEVDEFGDYHYAKVEFSDGAYVEGDWYDDGTWTKTGSNGAIALPWFYSGVEGEKGATANIDDPYYLAAVAAVEEAGIAGKGFDMPKLPMQIK